MKKTILTHVNSKAIQGLVMLANKTNAKVYMHPVPYGKNFDKFTVVIVRDK